MSGRPWRLRSIRPDDAFTYRGHRLDGSVEEFHAAVDALLADTVPQRYYEKVIAGKHSGEVTG